MKKILIWDVFPLKNSGGPSGYLYNLHEYLKEHPNEQIVFLSDLIGVTYASPVLNNENGKTYISRLWKRILHIINQSICVFYTIDYKKPNEQIIKQFACIHVHKVEHIAQIRKAYPNFTGKLILTSHCPSSWTDETLDGLISQKAKMKSLKCILRPIALKKELEVYRKSDFIMFPCKEAKEPYEKESKINRLFKSMEYKFFYVPTSLIDYKSNSQLKLTDYGIPDNAIVISFFGRHNCVKGYDVLKRTCSKILEKHPNVYMLCAGGGDIEYPSHRRWIELGIVHNIDDILPLVDLYILPNRDTYFDLITLQALRAGVPLLVSETGGNKYFKKLPQKETLGIHYFNIDDEYSIIRSVEDLISIRENDMPAYIKLRERNRELFVNRFTMDSYVENYINQINSL